MTQSNLIDSPNKNEEKSSNKNSEVSDSFKKIKEIENQEEEKNKINVKDNKRRRSSIPENLLGKLLNCEMCLKNFLMQESVNRKNRRGAVQLEKNTILKILNHDIEFGEEGEQDCYIDAMTEKYSKDINEMNQIFQKRKELKKEKEKTKIRRSSIMEGNTKEIKDNFKKEVGSLIKEKSRRRCTMINSDNVPSMESNFLCSPNSNKNSKKEILSSFKSNENSENIKLRQPDSSFKFRSSIFENTNTEEKNDSGSSLSNFTADSIKFSNDNPLLNDLKNKSKEITCFVFNEEQNNTKSFQPFNKKYKILNQNISKFSTAKDYESGSTESTTTFKLNKEKTKAKEFKILKTGLLSN